MVHTIYRTNPWMLPGLANYPLFPIDDIDFWSLGNLVQAIRVQEVSFPAHISFHSAEYAHFRLRDAFLCSGILMSPAQYDASKRAWGFFLEHAESLRTSSGTLRINADCIHWEERVRTIFSERFGLGLAGWLLWTSYDILHIADAGPFIARSISDPSSPFNKASLTSLGLYGKNGGLKPDLFCLTRSGECVIAESKGAIGPPGKLKNAKLKGKEQVNNIHPNRVNLRTDGGRLVFATNFRHENENPRPDKESCITVVDPIGSDDALQVDFSADEITLHSYCKLLSFCGLPHLANSLLQGNAFDPPELLREQIIEIGGRKVFPLLIRHGQAIGLDARVAEALFQNDEDLFVTTGEALPKLDSLASSGQQLALPNGMVFGAID